MLDRRPPARAIALTLLFSLALLPRLAAEESFRATHLAFFHLPGAQPERTNRLGIFRFDAGRRTLDYRITIIPGPEGRVTGLRLIRRRSGAQEEQILRSIELPPGGVTFTGTLDELSPEVLGAIDSGVVDVVVTSIQNTSSFVEARLDPIPNGVASSITSAATVPPAKDSKGFGSALFLLDEERRSARFYLQWEGLTGVATALQIQRGTVIDAGLLLETIELKPSLQGNAVGVWSDLTGDEMLALRSGRIYVNVTTEAYPAGEIRGEVNPIEVFTAALEPANEAPPVTGTSASGTGFFLITVDGNNGTVANAMVAAGDSRQELTGAFVHYGGIGQNGSIFTGLANGGLGGYFIPPQIMDEPADLASIRNAGMYVNITGTGYPNGELRGQLIPAALHVAFAGTIAAGPPLPDSASIGYDRSADAIRFAVAETSGQPTIVVSDMTGRRVLVVRASSHRGTLPARGLAAGAYVAQLVVGGRPVAARTIAVVR